MKRLILSLLLMTFLLSVIGCGKTDDSEYSGQTQTLEILLYDDNVVTLEIPIELVIEKTDNHYYWELSNDVTIFRTVTKTNVGTYSEDLDLYIGNNTLTRDFDNCSVTINFNKGAANYFKSYLAKAKVSKKSASVPDSARLEYLPSYQNIDMAMRGNLYMPDDTEGSFYTIYDAELFTKGSSWLQSWIMDSKIDGVKKHLLTLAIINTPSSGLSSCYESDDVVFYTTGTTVIAAKKLAMNSWYIYYGSADMVDYILSGIEAVHG